jgi:hypothetical protein
MNPGPYLVCLKFSQVNPNSPNDTCVAIICDSIFVADRKDHTKGGNNGGNKIQRDHKLVLSIYPIPASDILNFTLGEDHGMEVSYEIVNNFGVPVKTGNNKNGNFVDIGSLNSGLYIIRVFTTNDVYMKQFIKY